MPQNKMEESANQKDLVTYKLLREAINETFLEPMSKKAVFALKSLRRELWEELKVEEELETLRGIYENPSAVKNFRETELSIVEYLGEIIPFLEIDEPDDIDIGMDL